METLKSWVGKSVTLTLQSTIPVTLHGSLLQVDEIGFVLQQPKGEAFIPFTSILHVVIAA